VFIFGGAGAVLTLIVSLVLARGVTRPVYRLVEAAREIGRGNLMKPMDVVSGDEIGYLGETMEDMRRKILARDEQLRQMLGSVAHEIRNPLGGIEIYAGLIADDLPKEDPRKAHIQKVIGEVRTLDRVISEFLEFARPAPVQPEWVELGLLVEEAFFLVAPELEAGNIAYQTTISKGSRVFVDRGQIKQALVNVMKNAIQAMPEGGNLTVRAGLEADGVCLEVIDTGVGIAPSDLNRLFEPFFSTREKGSGLGLAIVQQIVRENGGRVVLESVPGSGTTCRLILPGPMETGAM
ncbi:MAG: ATP-binding protein, partial [bacterium]|nr:ATP-binding protein [bacterium]